MSWVPRYNHKNFMEFFSFVSVGIATGLSFLGYYALRRYDIVSKEDPSAFGICVLFANGFMRMAEKIFRIRADAKGGGSE